MKILENFINGTCIFFQFYGKISEAVTEAQIAISNDEQVERSELESEIDEMTSKVKTAQDEKRKAEKENAIAQVSDSAVLT